MACPTTGAVLLYVPHPDDFLRTHGGITLAAVADAIARLKHYRVARRWTASERHSGPVFFVPDDTLGAADARPARHRLGQ
jgi:hypothetical protein